MKEKLAKGIRVITIPPLLIAVTLIILYFNTADVFRNANDFWFAMLALDLIPLLAYPLSYYVPYFKKQGRKSQRTLAFVFSLVGYLVGVIGGYLLSVLPGLKLIFLSYLFSVILLSIANLLKIRASGHACGITGPLAILIYFFGAKAILPCILIFGGVIWSSLTLKRHKLTDLLLGSLTAVVSFILALLCV